MRFVNLNAFKLANELISKSKKIVIYGEGSSGLVAKEFEYQLIKIKKMLIVTLITASNSVL
ncbi:SIS domain-containing protein [Providencia hangzhouensis]